MHDWRFYILFQEIAISAQFNAVQRDEQYDGLVEPGCGSGAVAELAELVLVSEDVEGELAGNSLIHLPLLPLISLILQYALIKEHFPDRLSIQVLDIIDDHFFHHIAAG